MSSGLTAWEQSLRVGTFRDALRGFPFRSVCRQGNRWAEAAGAMLRWRLVPRVPDLGFRV